MKLKTTVHTFLRAEVYKDRFIFGLLLKESRITY